MCMCVIAFLPRDAMLAQYTVCDGHVTVCVCRQSEFYRNASTNRASFWHGSLVRPILCTDVPWHVRSLGGVLISLSIGREPVGE